MSLKLPKYDVLVMGMGFAGLSAALFAARQGLSVAVCGASGGLDFSTGLIDLMGVHPIEQGRTWENPWAAIAALQKDCPEHPYGLLSRSEIENSLEETGAFLAAQGLPYRGQAECNSRIVTPVGTLKRSYLIPQSIWPVVGAWESGAPTLVVDFPGLRGFSARQIVECLGRKWSGLRHVGIPFPSRSGELYPEHMAWSLSDIKVREELGASLAGHAKNVEYIAFPAILGIRRPMEIITHLEELTGRRIFEIPTLPPALAGQRIRAAYNEGLNALGVKCLFGQKVFGAECLGRNGWRLQLGHDRAQTQVQAKGVILAMGRLLTQGLRSDRHIISEPIFGLPVSQLKSRRHWSKRGFFDPNGHAQFNTGLITDSALHPLNDSGNVFHDTLHAAGTILANNNWTRRKCGAGLAIATAFKAVNCLTNSLRS